MLAHLAAAANAGSADVERAANTPIGPFMLSGDRFASFLCPDCTVKFTTLSHLQAHWLREHHRCQRQQQTTLLLQTTAAPAERSDCGHTRNRENFLLGEFDNFLLQDVTSVASHQRLAVKVKFCKIAMNVSI
ncbi:hypothetical protein HPB49_002570 [Dermacentor silvarum]|uniref:Uncharacterized protein n=1 Tax=Dermacentor silvarum TaxID=543639 RepID=A0ACB8DA56_DERSI|nr:hypothetical protein HPB49_002570 [Dermacentor silvarum]